MTWRCAGRRVHWAEAGRSGSGSGLDLVPKSDNFYLKEFPTPYHSYHVMDRYLVLETRITFIFKGRWCKNKCISLIWCISQPLIMWQQLTASICTSLYHWSSYTLLVPDVDADACTASLHSAGRRRRALSISHSRASVNGSSNTGSTLRHELSARKHQRTTYKKVHPYQGA